MEICQVHWPDFFLSTVQKLQITGLTTMTIITTTLVSIKNKLIRKRTYSFTDTTGLSRLWFNDSLHTHNSQHQRAAESRRQALFFSKFIRVSAEMFLTIFLSGSGYAGTRALAGQLEGLALLRTGVSGGLHLQDRWTGQDRTPVGQDNQA